MVLAIDDVAQHV